MRGRQAIITVGAGLVASVAVLTSMAWACSAQVGLAPLPVQAGPPGTRFTVAGQSTQPGQVEVRWNGIKGPVVGSATTSNGGHGTGFAAEVTVPDAAPGIYYLVLAAGDSGAGRAAFEVTPAAGAVNQSTTGSAQNPAEVWRSAASATERGVAVREPAGAAFPGAVLLVVGLVALLAGAGVAATRRTRVRATHAPVG